MPLERLTSRDLEKWKTAVPQKLPSARFAEGRRCPVDAYSVKACINALVKELANVEAMAAALAVSPDTALTLKSSLSGLRPSELHI